MSERDERVVEALAIVIRESVRVRLGANSRSVVEDGGSVRLTAAETEDATQALLDSPAMRDLLAEVWEDGYDAGRSDMYGEERGYDVTPEPNPYRREAR